MMLKATLGPYECFITYFNGFNLTHIFPTIMSNDPIVLCNAFTAYHSLGSLGPKRSFIIFIHYVKYREFYIIFKVRKVEKYSSFTGSILV